MSHGITKPDFSLLSRFLDHVLASEEEHELQKYLEHNPEEQQQVTRIEQALHHLVMTLADVSLWSQLQPRLFSQECLSPDEVSIYVARAVSLQERERMESHLRSCDPCLREVIEARKIASVVMSDQGLIVPAALQSRVAGEAKASLSRIVLQIAQRGLYLVEKHLIDPIRELQPGPLVVSLLRAIPGHIEATTLSFQLHAEGNAVHVTAVRRRGGLAATLTFRGSDQKALAARRITLRQDGRAILRAKTDEHGRLQVRHLDPGVYEVVCPELQLAFQLEIRV